jgi:hypothetical protein
MKSHTINKNVDNLLVASEEMGLEVNVDKTKYKVKFRNQSAGINQNQKIDSIYFERVELLKYLGKT